MLEAFPLDSLFWVAAFLVLPAIGALVLYLRWIPHPRSRLAYHHSVLLAALALPVIYVAGAVWTGMTAGSALAILRATFDGTGDRTSVLVLVYGAGVVVRLGMLVSAGLFRFVHYQLTKEPLDLRSLPNVIHQACTLTRASARFCISDYNLYPVTFGLLDPVALLPDGFPELGSKDQLRMLCHQLLQIRRKDRFVIVAEEVISVLFWFHPAVWWLLDQARSARAEWIRTQVAMMTASDSDVYRKEFNPNPSPIEPVRQERGERATT